MTDFTPIRDLPDPSDPDDIYSGDWFAVASHTSSTSDPTPWTRKIAAMDLLRSQLGTDFVITGGKIQLSGGGGGGGGTAHGYSSGWQVAANAGTYILNHNLGTTDVVATVWAATDSSGSNSTMVPWHPLGGGAAASQTHGGIVLDISATSCTLQLGNEGYGVVTSSGTVSQTAFSYAKLVMVAVTSTGGGGGAFASGYIDTSGTISNGNGIASVVVANPSTNTYEWTISLSAAAPSNAVVTLASRTSSWTHDANFDIEYSWTDNTTLVVTSANSNSEGISFVISGVPNFSIGSVGATASTYYASGVRQTPHAYTYFLLVGGISGGTSGSADDTSPSFTDGEGRVFTKYKCGSNSDNLATYKGYVFVRTA